MVDDADLREAPALARIDFSSADEARMSRLAWAMRLVGTLQCIFGGLGLLMGLYLVVSLMGRLGSEPVSALLAIGALLLVTAVPVYQGVLLREAGDSIDRAARDDDDDQENIASAFRRLKVVFMLEAALALLLALQLLK